MDAVSDHSNLDPCHMCAVFTFQLAVARLQGDGLMRYTPLPIAYAPISRRLRRVKNCSLNSTRHKYVSTRLRAQVHPTRKSTHSTPRTSQLLPRGRFPSRRPPAQPAPFPTDLQTQPVPTSMHTAPKQASPTPMLTYARPHALAAPQSPPLLLGSPPHSITEAHRTPHYLSRRQPS